MIDNIEPIPFLVIMALIVATWLIIGIRDRRRELVSIGAWLVARHRMYVDAGRCGAVWSDERERFDGVHWCDRPTGHTGPHLDTPTGAIRREHEPFIGGQGIRLHVHR